MRALRVTQRLRLVCCELVRWASGRTSMVPANAYGTVISTYLKSSLLVQSATCMVNKCIVVNVLTLVGYGHTAHIGVGSFSRKGNAGCVARCSVMQCHVIQKKTAVGLLINKHIAYTHRVVMSFFKLIQIKLCILAYVYLCNLCYQK